TVNGSPAGQNPKTLGGRCNVNERPNGAASGAVEVPGNSAGTKARQAEAAGRPCDDVRRGSEQQQEGKATLIEHDQHADQTRDVAVAGATASDLTSAAIMVAQNMAFAQHYANDHDDLVRSVSYLLSAVRGVSLGAVFDDAQDLVQEAYCRAYAKR